MDSGEAAGILLLKSGLASAPGFQDQGCGDEEDDEEGKIETGRKRETGRSKGGRLDREGRN